MVGRLFGAIKGVGLLKDTEGVLWVTWSAGRGTAWVGPRGSGAQARSEGISKLSPVALSPEVPPALWPSLRLRPGEGFRPRASPGAACLCLWGLWLLCHVSLHPRLLPSMVPPSSTPYRQPLCLSLETACPLRPLPTCPVPAAHPTAPHRPPRLSHPSEIVAVRKQAALFLQLTEI